MYCKVQVYKYPEQQAMHPQAVHRKKMYINLPQMWVIHLKMTAMYKVFNKIKIQIFAIVR